MKWLLITILVVVCLHFSGSSAGDLIDTKSHQKKKKEHKDKLTGNSATEEQLRNETQEISKSVKTNVTLEHREQNPKVNVTENKNKVAPPRNETWENLKSVKSNVTEDSTKKQDPKQNDKTMGIGKMEAQIRNESSESSNSETTVKTSTTSEKPDDDSNVYLRVPKGFRRVFDPSDGTFLLIVDDDYEDDDDDDKKEKKSESSISHSLAAVLSGGGLVSVVKALQMVFEKMGWCKKKKQTDGSPNRGGLAELSPIGSSTNNL